MSAHSPAAAFRSVVAIPAVVAATLALTVSTTQPPTGVAQAPATVVAADETTPVTHTGDAADDPAIWVHPTTPAMSLVLGNDKRGALEVYDLSGAVVQRITSATTFWGNVDVRQKVTIAGRTRDLVGVINGGMRFYQVVVTTRRLVSATDGTGTLPTGGGEGFCLYRSPTSATLYSFVVTMAGRVRQYRIFDSDSDGLLQSSLVREFYVGSEAEGCVADDQTGALYISQEDVALWRYGAEPTDGTSRTQVDQVGAGGHLVADVEGLALAHPSTGGGYLIASAQNVTDPTNSYFAVYQRTGANAYVKSFQVVAGANADGCQRTDGIAAYAGYLGPSFPFGLFVCQDNFNSAPGSVGNQDFKLVRLEKAVPL